MEVTPSVYTTFYVGAITNVREIQLQVCQLICAFTRLKRAAVIAQHEAPHSRVFYGILWPESERT